MIFFWILWAIDALVTIIVLYFFFAGLNDGTVSSFNGGLWFGILVVLAVVIGGSLYLKSISYLTWAKLLLAGLAFPALLFALYFLVAIISGTRWN
jgi:hypothetical protein